MSAPVPRDYEAQLYDHYGRPSYSRQRKSAGEKLARRGAERAENIN